MLLVVFAFGAMGLSEESPAGETSRGLTKELLKMDLVRSEIMLSKKLVVISGFFKPIEGIQCLE